MARRALGIAVGLCVVTAVAVLGSRTVEGWGGGSADVPRPVASVAGASLERDEALDRAAGAVGAAVVRIEVTSCGETRQGTATAVRVGGRTLVLSNRHVVRGADLVAVEGPDGPLPPATVASSVARRDAVRLDLPGTVDPLEAGPVPTVGAPVVVVGYPGGERRAAPGTVVSVERRRGYGGEVPMLIVDAPAEPGVSGGAVVDAEGRVVGLVAARDPRTHATVAYPVDTLAGTATPGSPSC